MKFIKVMLLIGFIGCMVSCDAIKNWMSSLKKQQTEESKVDVSSQESWVKENLDYLKTNVGQEGVQETASGLQYKVIKEGSGSQPGPTSLVEVHYKGTLINGTEFDSSYKRNQTAVFGLHQVIPGWTEGLQLMKEGAVYQFVIPSQLAYGNQASSAIPAGSTLIFEVELIKVQPSS